MMHCGYRLNDYRHLLGDAFICFTVSHTPAYLILARLVLILFSIFRVPLIIINTYCSVLLLEYSDGK